jgi:hypothetical protein
MVLQLLGPTRPAGRVPDGADPDGGVVPVGLDEPGELVQPEMRRITITIQTRRIRYGDFMQGPIREFRREAFK